MLCNYEEKLYLYSHMRVETTYLLTTTDVISRIFVLVDSIINDIFLT